jgi:Na+-driven multidrug efflux pump
MALALVGVVWHRARVAGVPARPRPGRVLEAARGGLPLVVRTVALRTILLVAVWAAAQLGDAPLAAHQIVATVWSVLAFTVDALVIAAQAIVGRELGAGRVAAARAATGTMLRWGVAGGLGLGVIVLVTRGWWLPVFSPDLAVQRYAAAALVVVGLGQPVAGYVFVADGVLMGAGDFRYLATAMLATLAAYLVVVSVVRAAGGGLVHVWSAFVVMMVVRGVTLWARLRAEAWAVTGAG